MGPTTSPPVGHDELDFDAPDCDSEEVLEEPARPARSGLGSKRSRAAEVNNLSEKRRRSRINERMKALQNLIPNSNKVISEKQQSIPLPSLTATSSIYKENEETEAVTAFLAPLALLTESPGSIYKDPKEKAKSETRDWLNNLVTDLESQIDNFELEADGLTVKKGKTRPARLTHLETSISRHKAHIVKLEVVLRLLDNDGLSPDQVNDIKDFLEDYVERNQENFDEFDDVDELYSSLPLDQELEELAALGPTLVKAALSATTQKTIVQDQSEEPSPQDANSDISPRIPPSKSGTMGSLVSAPLSSVGCGTPSGSSSAVTANILVQPLVGGPTAASTISGPVTVQGVVENSAAAVSSSLLNSSNLVKEDDTTFPTRKSSPAIPEIGLGRGIGRGISTQVYFGVPMSLGSVGGIDGNVALGSATPVSDTAKRNMLSVDERVGAGVSQTLVSPLSNRILSQQVSKNNEGTASNDSNNVSEGVGRGRVFPTSVVTGVQWKPQSLSPYQNQNETGQFRGRPEITPDQREKFLERFEQIEQVKQQGHNSLLTVPHLSGANYKQSSPQQQNLSLQQLNSQTPSLSPQVGLGLNGQAQGLASVTSATQQRHNMIHQPTSQQPLIPTESKDADLQQNIHDDLNGEPTSISSTSKILNDDEPKTPYMVKGTASLSESIQLPRDTDLSLSQPLQMGQSSSSLGVIGRKSVSDLGAIGDNLSGSVGNSGGLHDLIHNLQMLEAAYHQLPQPQDSERAKNYVPRHPAVTPASYPQTPSPIVDNPAFWEQMGLDATGTDTLFFAFYYQQNTYQQYLAAKELKRQSWRYHKKYTTWFQRHEEPKITNDNFERGTYVYFDFHIADDGHGWCQRIKTEFTFEYKYLEDDLVSDLCGGS